MTYTSKRKLSEELKNDIGISIFLSLKGNCTPNQNEHDLSAISKLFTL